MNKQDIRKLNILTLGVWRVIPWLCVSCAALLALYPGNAGTTGDPPSNPYVKVQTKLTKFPLPPGGEGEIQFTLTPAEGIHVNADPAPAFVLDSGTVVEVRGTPRWSKRDDTTLSPIEPVRQKIVIASDARAGVHRIVGTFTYYYCSETEGWCMRYREAVRLTVNVGP